MRMLTDDHQLTDSIQFNSIQALLFCSLADKGSDVVALSESVRFLGFS